VILRAAFLRFACFVFLYSPLLASNASAWGCKGHQTVALIAENHLTPESRQFLDQLLKDNPVDPQLKRFCGNYAASLLADSSTWPDDIRGTRKNGPWHYIDIPRNAPHAPLANFCGDSGCVTQAIADQLAILQDPHADPQKRADAARYVIHFVGDLHMPLHASSNNDQSGSCVPVGYLRRVPREHDHHFDPNLHSAWDTLIVERNMQGAEPREYADFLEESFRSDVDAWQKAGMHVEDWTWESHDLAETFAYGNLQPKDPVEAPVSVHSCTDDNNVGDRLLQMHFVVSEKYQDAAAPVVEKRIAQAGIRLAMILNEAARSAQYK
jgi:nuclease S1